jgi:hypothetical protein
MRSTVTLLLLLLVIGMPVRAADSLKITGYLQAQYVQDERSRNELGGSNGTRNLDQFSVRRGRVKFTWQVTPTARLVVQPDFSSSGTSLTDAYAEVTEPWTKWKNTLTAGQFTWPFGFELQYSSSNREMPERSRVIRTLFSGNRDRGVMLSGRGLAEKLHYQVAVVNGTGTSRSDDLNQEKDVVARVTCSFGKVALGGSLYEGTELVATSANSAGTAFDKTRHGVDVQWTTPLPGFALRGEYIAGTQPPAPNSTRGASDVTGWYVYALQRVGMRHQFAVRLDEYDADSDLDSDAIRTLGASYALEWDKHNKVMAAYEIPRHESNDVDDDVFTLRYQLRF